MELDYNLRMQEEAKGTLFEVMKNLDDDKEVFPELREEYEEVIKKVNDLRLKVLKRLNQR